MQEWEVRHEKEVKKIEQLELHSKKLYYQNINSIRKNIQFFFWLAILSMVSYVLLLVLNS